ncbi:hypothetical protein OCH239_21945 [Roseivivax halodurans JCM 10272]|uniref:DUF1499 domain-containing protein n=1 Tax=Roseivivax halodurans JCM 10272 TaxID=1449350 RepID=X7EFL0_9RHOB|nr:DUF1499 domain-containing protein [Roseivivax halodurans]ETX14670.1 hypothetical protein OCH239_21945 [Roseivivax halodurans JCM 10272]
MKIIFWLILLLVLGGLAWIRFAPSDPNVWHVDPQASADQDLAGGVRRRIAGDTDTLQRLDGIITSTVRTERLAGSVDSGRVTYVTRSKWFGFPDYTTVQLSDGTIEIYARLRFGQADMGVNKARVEGWLRQLREET